MSMFLHAPAPAPYRLGLSVCAPATSLPHGHNISIAAPVTSHRISSHLPPLPLPRHRFSLHLPAAALQSMAVSDDSDKKGTKSDGDGGVGVGKSAGRKKRINSQDFKLQINYSESFHLKIERSNPEESKKKSEKGWLMSSMPRVFKVVYGILISGVFVLACATMGKPDGEKKFADVLKVMTSYGDLI